MRLAAQNRLSQVPSAHPSLSDDARRAQSRNFSIIVLMTTLSAFVAGCASFRQEPGLKAAANSAEPQPPAPSVAPQPAEPVHKRRAAHLAQKKAPDKTPAISAAAVVGLVPQAVVRRLGKPSNTERDLVSTKWTYLGDSCSMQVFFYPDVEGRKLQVLKVWSAASDGQPLRDQDLCVRQIITVKSNAAH